MAGTFSRLTLLVVPLLIVAIHSAPSWPARAQMWEGQGREVLLEASQRWEQAVCVGSAGTWCHAPQQIPSNSPVHTEDPPVLAASLATSKPNPASAKQETIEPEQKIDMVQAGGMLTSTTSVGATSYATPHATTAPGLVLMVGDSLMTGVATGLRGELPPQYKIVDRAKPSTGLSNREYYDWPTTAGGMAAELSPSWVVIHLGGNDGQDIRHEGTWLRFGSQAWADQYLARAQALIRQIQINAPDAQIAWVGLPPMRAGKYADKSTRIEQLQRQAAESLGIAYIDGALAMGGTYQKSGPGPDGRIVVLRNDDGIHYSRAGGAVLSQALGRRMRWPLKHP